MCLLTKQKPAYEIWAGLEFRLVLFRSRASATRSSEPSRTSCDTASGDEMRDASSRSSTRRARWFTRSELMSGHSARFSGDRKSVVYGQGVDLGGRRIIKKKRISSIGYL